jgi:hypothetical protein
MFQQPLNDGMLKRENAIYTEISKPKNCPMSHVTIYQPAKTAMQSGMAKTKCWKLEFKATSGQSVEPLMGWVGQRDTQQQLSLFFETCDQAVTYAEANDLPYRVVEPHHRNHRPKSYAENFKFEKIRKTS